MGLAGRKGWILPPGNIQAPSPPVWHNCQPLRPRSSFPGGSQETLVQTVGLCRRLPTLKPCWPAGPQPLLHPHSGQHGSQVKGTRVCWAPSHYSQSF